MPSGETNTRQLCEPPFTTRRVACPFTSCCCGAIALAASCAGSGGGVLCGSTFGTCGASTSGAAVGDGAALGGGAGETGATCATGAAAIDGPATVGASIAGGGATG